MEESIFSMGEFGEMINGLFHGATGCDCIMTFQGYKGWVLLENHSVVAMGLRAPLLDSYLKNVKRNLKKFSFNVKTHNSLNSCVLQSVLTETQELIKEFESFEKQIRKRQIASIDAPKEVFGHIRHFVKKYQKLVQDLNAIYRDRCCLVENPKTLDYLSKA